jgi:glycosyltransferase involved in cell wall biosynthesis
VLPTVVVANSQETMTTIPGTRRRRIVYNPIVPDSVVDVLEITQRDAPDLVIGMIGRFSEWKGQDIFLRAFARVFAGANVVARLVGSPLFGEEDYEVSLRQLAHELDIADQVEFRGFRENVWLELREMDVLVHCSIRPEPFGQVVLEGMAAGVPVIAANAGGPAELITNGVDGILIRSGDSVDLARALRHLAANRELRRTIGAAGKVRSLEFTPERTVRRLLEVYNQILDRS